jgi:hypothetical protein
MGYNSELPELFERAHTPHLLQLLASSPRNGYPAFHLTQLFMCEQKLILLLLHGSHCSTHKAVSGTYTPARVFITC